MVGLFLETQKEQIPNVILPLNLYIKRNLKIKKKEKHPTQKVGCLIFGLDL